MHQQIRLGVSEVTVSDGSFIENASYFLLQQSLIGQRDVNYENYVREIDPRILKDFLGSIVQNFCILDGKIESIRFTNGVSIDFCIKAKTDKNPQTPCNQGTLRVSLRPKTYLIVSASHRRMRKNGILLLLPLGRPLKFFPLCKKPIPASAVSFPVNGS